METKDIKFRGKKIDGGKWVNSDGIIELEDALYTVIG